MFTLYLAIHTGLARLLLPRRGDRAGRHRRARSGRPRSSACRGCGRRSRPASRRCSPPSRTRAGGPPWPRPWPPACATCESCQYGQQTPAELAAEFAAAEEAVLQPIRSLLGLGEAEIVVSAAAPLPPEVGAFFAGLGLRILDVYGMTETTGAFTANTLEALQAGHRGQARSRHRGRIAEDGEILTRGPLNTPRLPQPARADRRADRRRRLAAHRRHRVAGRGRLPVRDGPQEGADHHRRRREHGPGRGSRTCWSPTR